jgi:PAS domain S-box-containing protein
LTVFHQLFDLYDKPLLLVRKTGVVVKANVLAKTQWPVLIKENSLLLAELPTDLSQDQIQELLAPNASAPPATTNRLQFRSQTRPDTCFQARILASEGQEILLAFSELQPQAAHPLPPLAYLRALIDALSKHMVAVVDTNMRYITFNRAYQQEYGRIFATSIQEGDYLLDTLKHLPAEQEKALTLFEEVIQGKSLAITQSFGHDSLRPKTFSFEFTPLPDDGGQLAAVLYVVKEIEAPQSLPQRLPELEQRFRSLAENTPDVVMRLDKNLTVLFVNRAITKETGRQPGDYTGISLYELPGAQRIPDTYFQKIRQVFQTGEERDLVSVFMNEGEESDFYTRFVPEVSTEGELVSVLAISRNISELRKAQKDLRQAQDFVFMADVVPLLIWITEPNGDVNYFNSRWYAYTGTNSQEGLHWGWQKSIHPDDLQHTLQCWEQALQQGQEYKVEYRLRRYDGAYRWFIAQALPMRTALGEIVKWYGFCADVHDQRQYQHELSQKAQELQSLNQMIPQLVWVTQPNGDYEYYNQRWYSYTGLSYEESKDKDWTLVLHPDDHERTLAVWQHCLETGEPYQIEYRLRRHDGVYRWFIGRANPLRNERGHIIKWFGTCTDIQEDKEQREALSRKNLELQQINSYLDQFVHTAAHDLRAPVANMKLLNEMLLREDHPERHKKLLQTFKPLLNRLDNTLVGLVEIMQMQEGHHQLRVQEVEPGQVLEQVKEELAAELSEAEATLEQELEQELSRPLYYIRPYLISILRNLLSNAIKYREAGRPLQIKVKGGWQGSYYKLQVSDNGSGIDLQRHSKNLFKPFKRLSVKSTGLGIGLHMVQNMVQKNGGMIDVSSSPEKGTTFSLLLVPYEGGRELK